MKMNAVSAIPKRERSEQRSVEAERSRTHAHWPRPIRGGAEPDPEQSTVTKVLPLSKSHILWYDIH